MPELCSQRALVCVIVLSSADECVLVFVCLGEEAAVFVIHQCEGEGMDHGVSDSLHQSDWRPTREGGASGWLEKWSSEF